MVSTAPPPPLTKTNGFYNPQTKTDSFYNLPLPNQLKPLVSTTTTPQLKHWFLQPPAKTDGFYNLLHPPTNRRINGSYNLPPTN